jgi:glycosyltransferase involved in cell wall biosynthesis
MKLSVIIPFFSEIHLINRTLNSVKINCTSFSEVQIILVNDGTLKEHEIRSCISSNLNKLVTIVKNKFSKGAGNARNTGLDMSNGDIIAFLDADDYWLPGKMELQMQEIKKGATFVVTSYYFDKTANFVQPVNKIYKTLDVFSKRKIGTSTVVITKELLENHRFRNIKFAQDIDFWFLLANSKKFKYAAVKKKLTIYNTSGLTQNKLVQFTYLNKVLRLNKINVLAKIKCNINYIIDGLYRHFILKIFFKINNFRGLRFFWIYFTELILFDLKSSTSTFLRVTKNKQKIELKNYVKNDGLLYVASFTSVVLKTLHAVKNVMGPERFRRAQFIDAGCGKGKVLIIYKKYLKNLNINPPIGLDYDAKLIDLALTNIANTSLTKKDIRIFCENAINIRKYVKSKEAIIYLYNSFQGKVFDDTLDSLKDLPHVLIYIDPAQLENLKARGYKILAKNKGLYHADTWVVASLSLKRRN